MTFTDEQLAELNAMSKEVARLEAKEFFDYESRRRSIFVAIFAGANIAVVIGVLITFYLAGMNGVFVGSRELIRQVAESDIVRETTKGIAEATRESFVALAEIKQKIRSANEEMAVNSAAVTARIDSTASEFQNRFDKIRGTLVEIETKAGDPELLNQFRVVSDLLSRLKSDQPDDPAKKILAAIKLASNIEDLIPLATIVAWHRNVDVDNPKQVTLQNENWVWLECSGQTIRRRDYPEFFSKFVRDGIDETRLDNLNGDGRFLRGSSRSGLLQPFSTAMPLAPFIVTPDGEHDHLIDRSGPTGRLIGTAEGGGDGGGDQSDIKTRAAGRHSHSIIGGDSETRPVNMSVVWIIRVK